jgi:hypothetical protein
VAESAERVPVKNDDSRRAPSSSLVELTNGIIGALNVELFTLNGWV